ncbi:MAG: hypothetical protein ACKO32_14485, partial [Planctomycetia bacterium]
FKVDEKTKLTKTFVEEASFSTTDFRIEVDGNEIDAEGMPDISIAVTNKTSVKVTDEYVKMGEGKPLVLKRTFDELAGDSVEKVDLPEGAPGGDQEKETKRESKLEGQTITFTWKEKEEEYEASYGEDSKDGDAELIADLTEDMDLRGFLPDEGVKPEDSWELTARELFEIVGIPGGDMHIDQEGDDEEERPTMSAQMLENCEGKGTATFVETREVDGKKLAVIKIAGEVKSNGSVPMKNPEGAPPMERSRKIEVAYECEGELLWDPAAGHFIQCEIASQIKMTMRMSMEGEGPDGSSHKIDQVFEFEGEAKFSASID